MSLRLLRANRSLLLGPCMKLRGIAAALGALILSATAMADEGMWTFDNFPAAAVKAKYGVTIDRAWLDHVRLATARLSTGCSASIVSGEGLALTNHHCVAACVHDLSTTDRDYLVLGYAAATHSEERQCPGMQAEVLISIDDVTDQVRAATAGKAGAEVVKARDATVANIEKTACLGKEAIATCEVTPLYQGGLSQIF